MIGYNASAGLFTLYNPWGCDQPGVLSWSQLEATCDGFVVADTTGSVPISGANLHAPVAAAVSAHFGRRGRSLDFAFGHDEPRRDPPPWTTVPAAETGSAASPAATGDTYETRPATIFSDRSTRHDSTAKRPTHRVAAGVDAVLASEDLGTFTSRSRGSRPR